MPISREEFEKLPKKPLHEYLKEQAFAKLKEMGFINIEHEKALGDNRDRFVDVYAEKEEKKVGVEVWTDRNLIRKLEDYNKSVDRIIIVIPVTNTELWSFEIPEIYRREIDGVKRQN